MLQARVSHGDCSELFRNALERGPVPGISRSPRAGGIEKLIEHSPVVTHAREQCGTTSADVDIKQSTPNQNVYVGGLRRRTANEALDLFVDFVGDR